MSIQETQDKLEDEAYQVVEATNEDGTIDGEIVETPERDGDDLVLMIRPLIPNAETEACRMDWPESDSDEYVAVRLCRDLVGGFQAISQLEGETVRLNKDDNSWSLVLPEDGSDGFLDSYINTDSNLLKLGAVASLAGFIAGVLGVTGVIALVLLSPFGVSVFGFWQGTSVLVGSLIFAVCSLVIGTVVEDKINGY